MTFQEKLNDYIKELGISSRELAESADISESVISRYRSGDRLPKQDSDSIHRISLALSAKARDNGLDTSAEAEYSSELIYAGLLSALPNARIDKEEFITRLNSLISTLNMSISKFSKSSSYDPSFVSRVIKGKRSPSDYVLFARRIGDFCASAYHTDPDLDRLSVLMNIPKDSIDSISGLSDAMVSYLLNRKVASKAAEPELSQSDNDKTETPQNTSSKAEPLLSQIDDFDLDAYMTSIHFDKIKLPSVPFKPVSNKTYTGAKGMKNAELDFMRAVAFSNDKSPVYMYSTLPMITLSKDKDFYKKYMFYLAVIIKKGHDIHIIHHLDRPDEEMITGLMGWIPVYMTGQVHPYYFPGKSDPLFRHFLRFAEGVAAIGECIGDDIDNALISITKTTGELGVHRERVLHVFDSASPLMNIFRSEDEEAYRDFLRNEIENADESSECIRILSAPSLHTLSHSQANDMVLNGSFTDTDTQKFHSNLDFQAEMFQRYIRNGGRIEEYINKQDESDFAKHPAHVSISGTFINKNIEYTYDQYIRHVENEIRVFSGTENVACHLTDGSNYPFRNIQITILKGKWAMISKNTAPAIHFVIHHPKLVNAILELL